jgi:YVTN family beta-propeller protein
MLAGCGRRGDAGAARIYVSNEVDGTVTVIDAAKREVVATVPVGKRPRGLHVSHDRKWLYVALSGSPRGGPGVDESQLPPPDRGADGIGVIDLSTLKLVRTITSGPDPESFDLVGDDQLVVSNEDAGEASLVTVKDGTVRSRVAVGREPEGVATTPDGKHVFVTSEGDERVTVIEPRSARAVATIPTGSRPRGIAFSHDGATAFVTNETDGSVSILDARAFTAAGSIRIPNTGSSAIGPRPMGIAFARDGHELYVTTGRGASVAVIDPDLHKVSRVISDVGARPWGIAVAPDGMLYTANGSSNDVSVIDPAAGKVIARIRAGAGPWGVAVDR